MFDQYLEFEVNLLRLLEQVTNGTKVEINATGTSLYFAPGALIGGAIEHECSLQRGIGYYLEVMLYLAPFMKSPLELRLKGVTNDRDDPSVIQMRFYYVFISNLLLLFFIQIDMIKYSAPPIMRRFLGSDDGLEFKVDSNMR